MARAAGQLGLTFECQSVRGFCSLLGKWGGPMKKSGEKEEEEQDVLLGAS